MLPATIKLSGKVLKGCGDYVRNRLNLQKILDFDNLL
jgi:hypothetical protein